MISLSYTSTWFGNGGSLGTLLRWRHEATERILGSHIALRLSRCLRRRRGRAGRPAYPVTNENACCWADIVCAANPASGWTEHPRALDHRILSSAAKRAGSSGQRTGGSAGRTRRRPNFERGRYLSRWLEANCRCEWHVFAVAVVVRATSSTSVAKQRAVAATNHCD